MYAVIRVRGRTGIKKNIADNLNMLNLTRISHATVIPETPSYDGMLQKGKDYITWGEISEDTLKELISVRGRLPGDKRVTDEYVKENTDYDSVDALATAIFNQETTMKDAGLKPIFRLNPPRKGYEGTKKPYTEGGSLGYRSENINELIEKMI
ncbi:50S ribosomal protein L30 [Methanosphaera cuniculi]|uniref:Large ribosomal subunit protein uL30 n=1 Tax=Methanosphaera cuniculi TaxID=1077256 RepID=A0A2A2HAW9_9EURY|nr:50S ribosomal protein L30 [Methanosphaera cuniculi]PAV06651.1 50S ribosomal protein L30 [Methanosphaera cuniculi]PWL07839.1 50S ribosomal protein L30 [Methanosphaera cuniculi]